MNTEQGLPGSPPTEDEMNSVQDILKRAISAVVGMSQLQADVDMLRQTVAGLQSDSDRLRNHNESLDEALHQSRMTRNDLTTKLSQVEMDLRHVSIDRDDLTKLNEKHLANLAEMDTKLHSAEQRADDAELRVMELEDELQAANAKLDAARALFAPEPIKSTEPASEPGPQAAPEPIVEEPKPTMPTRTYYGNEWAPGRMWDVDKGQYYDEIPF